MASSQLSKISMLLVFLGWAAVAQAGSETPPPGAPWKRVFGEAHREALKSGKPIFIYFTKTY